MMSDKRPLSPHLQIYKPQLTSFLSILHRATGFALSVGSLALVFWVVALAKGGDSLLMIHSFWSSIFGKFFLLGWLFCFVYHFYNGIRHLIWDVNLFLDIDSVYKSGWAVVGLTAVTTIGIWLIGGGF
jgi:succinate dehydrogenase / fumarate reductase cytochrome b subunit